MNFCPKCGSLMIPKREGNQTFLVCRKCGYKEIPKGVSLREEKRIEHSVKDKTIVVETPVEVKVLPKTRAECPKCGHNEAYWWMIQTRRADEAPTRFFRCTKCGYTWREYD